MDRKRKISQFVLPFFVFCLAFMWIMPLLKIVLESFEIIEEQGEIAKYGMQQYRRILLETPVYLHMYWNSVFITVTVVLGSIAVSLLGAYGFTILRFKGKEVLFFIYIIVMLLPLQVTMMPNYLVARALHLEESYWAVILPAVFNPFGVFLLRQQMRHVPWECVEAARMDGAGWAYIFRRIFCPMVKSGIMALAMLLVIEYWNLVDQVIVFIRQPEKYPLSVYLDQISREMESVSNSAAVFYLIPVVALLCYGHKYLKEGIGLMNVKE